MGMSKDMGIISRGPCIIIDKIVTEMCGIAIRERRIAGTNRDIMVMI